MKRASGGVAFAPLGIVAHPVIFVTDIKRSEEVWQAREAFSGDFQVSTLVEVRALAAPELLVEVEAIAVLGAGGA